MEQYSKGIFLSQRSLGESQYVVRVFSAEHGLISGVARLSRSPTPPNSYLPGDHVHVHWRARLEEHLGKIRLEREDRQFLRPLALEVTAMQALMTLCSLLQKVLCERAVEGELYAATTACLRALAREGWPRAYLEWERELLEKLGFGLDLSCCAVEGCTEKLFPYISPKTGRGICRTHAEPYLSQVMRLPVFWQGAQTIDAPWTRDDLRDGFAVTEHFLCREFLPNDKTLTDFRRNMLEKLYKSS